MGPLVNFFAFLIILGFVGLLLTFGVVVIGFGLAFIVCLFVFRKLRNFFNPNYAPNYKADESFTYSEQTTYTHSAKAGATNSNKTQIFDAEFIEVKTTNSEK